MDKYLISFSSAAMVVPDSELEAAGRDAYAVVDEAKAACARIGRWHRRRRGLSVGATAQRWFHGVGTSLS